MIRCPMLLALMRPFLLPPEEAQPHLTPTPSLRPSPCLVSTCTFHLPAPPTFNTGYISCPQKMFPALCLSLYPYSSETNFSKISHNLTPSCLWGHFNVLYLADITCKVFVLFQKKVLYLGKLFLILISKLQLTYRPSHIKAWHLCQIKLLSVQPNHRHAGSCLAHEDRI